MNSSTNFLKPFLKLLLIILSAGSFYKGSCLDTDYLNRTLVLTDSDTINSVGHRFTLGFFSPNGTNRRYLGIWYYVSPSAVVWVANKDRPLNDSSGTATISSDGNIVVMNGDRAVIWSSDAVSSPTNTTAQLLNSGNLILTNTLTRVTIWQTHEHPGNSFLPMMRLTYDAITNQRLVLNAWRSPQDPRDGNFSIGLNRTGVSQAYTWNNGKPFWRTGPWNGQIFTGVANLYLVYSEGFNIGSDGNGTYYIGRSFPDDLLLRTYLDTDGTLVEVAWDNQTRQWNVKWRAPNNKCDVYNTCGPFGLCYERSTPICSCLIGYKPKNQEEWDRGNWTEGCVRSAPLQCERENNASDKGKQDGFSMLRNVKLPDFIIQWSAININENECRSRCLSSCSYLAYAFDPGMGCLLWSDALIDVQHIADTASGSDFYFRIPYSLIERPKKHRKLVIIVSVITSMVAASICLFCSWRIYKRRTGKFVTLSAHGTTEESQTDSKEIFIGGVDIKELPLYSFDIVANATNGFDVQNKLGMGGFGPVYQGKLENGQEIAVKRLSAVSGQGLEEFMNEVLVISKLQHRNLVRLLGCCVERDEKMLIYEYLRNRSLDCFLFDKTQDVLDWKKRLNIMEGIGRGLLYLHRDSRLRIIHRDLKPSNILLDDNWNPKISDFGMAKIFEGNQDQDNTRRVMGTYGYMAPEYAMGGIFSEKSDVFSFGVLVLEIISGRRNARFYHNQLSFGLLGYAWKLWSEDNPEDLIDERISNPKALPEIMRCLWIGLLCVQESPQARPSMSTVLAMLSSEIVDLAVPEHPGFTDKWSHVDPSISGHSSSTNKVSVTMMEGR